LSIYLLSLTLFWKNKQTTELENTNQIQNLHNTQCILYLDEKKRNEKGNMIIWIAINNPPKTNFDVPIPTNFLSLRDQRAYKFSSTTTITTTSKTIFRKTNKQTRVFVPPILIIIHHDWIEIQHLWYVRLQSILNHRFRRSNQTFSWVFFAKLSFFEMS